MAKLLSTLGLLLLFGCTQKDFQPDKEYIQQRWRAVQGTQFFEFYSDSKARMITLASATKLDTYDIDYKFEPDSALIQLDLMFNTMPLKGLNLFGVVEFTHPDTFLYYSEKGFPEMGEKYRPNRMDYVKAIPYVRVKE